MLDKLVLAVLRERSKYRTLVSSVPTETMSTTTAYILKAYGSYFESNPEMDYIDFTALGTHIRLKTGADPKQMAAVEELLTQLEQYKPSKAEREGVLNQLVERDSFGRMGMLCQRWEAGEEFDFIAEADVLINRSKRSRGQASVTDCVDDDVLDIMQEMGEDRGFKFRLLCLQEAVRGLQLGDSIAVGARPDAGKTSFIADNLTYMAEQAHRMFPGRPILWFNNEGPGKNIIPRLYSAALRKNLTELIELGKAGKLKGMYADALGAPPNIIRVKDMHGANLAKAEQVIEAMRPCIVVWDMLANFKLAAVGDGNSNKASQVEQLWQEVREMAVRQEFLSIATVQVSADGKDDMFPSLDALKDSKTGIQGATEVVIMIGKVDDPQLEARRGISTPKNKRQVPGRPGNLRAQVHFYADRTEFQDM